MIRVICNGCDADLTTIPPTVVIKPRSISVNFMPEGDAHLCLNCSNFVVTAILQRRESLKDPHAICGNCSHKREKHAKGTGCYGIHSDKSVCVCDEFQEAS